VYEWMLEMSATLKLTVAGAVEVVMLEEEEVVVVVVVMAAVDGEVVMVRPGASKEEGEASSETVIVGTLYAKAGEGEGLR
jgi:hypothetical protein